MAFIQYLSTAWPACFFPYSQACVLFVAAALPATVMQASGSHAGTQLHYRVPDHRMFAARFLGLHRSSLRASCSCESGPESGSNALCTMTSAVISVGVGAVSLSLSLSLSLHGASRHPVAWTACLVHAQKPTMRAIAKFAVRLLSFADALKGKFRIKAVEELTGQGSSRQHLHSVFRAFC